MAETSVRQWLSSIGCDQYVTLFEGNGYYQVESLSALDEDKLTVLGVFDPNHRRAILNKASAAITSDFDDMLGDLSSVIKDLEAFTVPVKVDSRSLSTNTVAPNKATKTRSYVVPEPPKPVETDFDLDSLLDDLTSFNPSAVVAASHSSTSLETPSPHTTPSHQHKAPSPAVSHSPATQSPVHTYTPPSAHSTPHSTPVHNHSSTPPHTPSHGLPPRSYTEVVDIRPRSRAPTDDRQRSYSQGSMGDREADGEDGDRDVQMVPQPDLSGATDQISAEDVQQRLERRAEELKNDPSLTEEERESRLRDEKMRIGLEKIKLAHKKKVAIKVFNPDRSNKTVIVEEGMTSSMVCHLLVVKNHFDESPNWVIVEQLGDTSLERELEDHELVVDVYSTWPREHNNVFLFKQNGRKYDLFQDPIKYFPFHLKTSQAAAAKVSTLERAEKARKILLQEYFSTTNRVPELEGWLHFKDGYKKSWKKIYFILRASGLYYSKSGKQKTAKHLALLVQFEDYELFHGINFKKTLKAPTQFCFALRPHPRQFIPGPKDIKVLCSDDEQTALSWTAGIRLAKYGLQLRDNFHKAKMTQFKLEDLSAPEGAKPKAGDRASKLVGLRLEKHMEKIREQYQAQKAEEEERRLRYNSPHVAHKETEDTSTASESSLQTPDRTPDPSPQLQPKPSRHEEQANGPREPPPVLPRPTQATPYNPYPAPSQPAPPPRRSPENNHPKQPPPVLPRPQSPPRLQQPPPQPVSPPRGSPDREALFAFAWYHGAVARDEAVKRLEDMGGYDGSYLVRDSTTVANSYVLTMYAKGVAKNFQVLPLESPNRMVMYRIDDGPAFSSIDQLLRHYKQDSDRLPCRLTEFCPRPPTRMTEC